MKRLILIGISLLFCVLSAQAQGPKDLVINEILVNNVQNFEDDYGHRVSWIELFNTGYSQVNVSSCYLVVSSNGETISYRVPKSDPRTVIAPQGYLVFFCEGTQSKGTFHTNFTLGMGTENAPAVLTDTLGSISIATPATAPDQWVTLSLLEANGKDTISSVRYNLAQQQPDVAMGRIKTDDDTFEFTFLESTTPYATNDTSDPIPPHEEFRRTDPIGYGMAVTAMTVVFSALLCLYLLFRTVGKLMVRMADKKKAKGAEGASVATAVTAAKKGTFSGEEMAAIATALRLYENDLHDTESAILTINRVAKVYSPWSSKLYGMTPPPARNVRK